VKFVGGGKRPQVIDGPFTESKELIAGFSILQVRSKAEAIEWASRAPFYSLIGADKPRARERRVR
jgi:hypothetical protein